MPKPQSKYRTSKKASPPPRRTSSGAYKKGGDHAKKLTPDEELLHKSLARFKQAHAGEKYWREQRTKWRNYYDGAQWSDEELETLRERGQPPVVINKTKTVVDGVVGLQMGSRTMMKAQPRGLNDADAANLISEGLRAIEDGSEFEEAQPNAFETVLIDGRSYYSHEVHHSVGMGEDPEFKASCLDNDDCYLDPHCKRADMLDAKDIFLSNWWDTEDLVEAFPDSKKEIEESCSSEYEAGDDGLPTEPHQRKRPDQYRSSQNAGVAYAPDLFVDSERKRVRVILRYYRVMKRHKMYYHPSLGKVVLSSLPEKDQKKIREFFPLESGGVEWDELGWQLNSVTFIRDHILEQKKNLRSWDEKAKFPIVMVPGFITKGDGRRCPYGFVKQLVDPQDEVNKRRSKMIHMINVAQIIGEDGCVQDIDEARRQLAKPDGVVIYNQDRKFEIQRGIELVAPHFQMYQEAKREMEECGVNRELTGTPSDASSSGRKVQVRQAQNIQTLRKLFMSLKGAHKRIAQLWLEDMQHYKTGEWLIEVTDNPKVKHLVLNEIVREPNGMPAIDPATGEPKRRNRINFGKYDIKLEETEDTLTLQNETFQALATLAGTGKVPIPADMLVRASPLPDKEELINRLNTEQQMRETIAALQAQLAQYQAAAQGVVA